MQEPGLETVKLFDVNSTQDVRLIALLGDSWTSKGRLESEIVDDLPRDYINIRPHATSSAAGNNSLSGKIVVAEGAFLENYSKGGYTLDKFLDDPEKLNKWAREVPEVTILHVGACDLANSGKYDTKTVKKQFPKDLSSFLRKWQDKARESLNERGKVHFNRRLENHKWLIVKIPVWDQCNGIKGISKNKFAYMRKRVNTTLKNARTTFWKEFRAIIVAIDLQYPKFDRKTVHLTSECQKQYNELVLGAASKLICEFCPWTIGEFVPAEHNRLLRKYHYCKKDTLAPHRIII